MNNRRPTLVGCLGIVALGAALSTLSASALAAPSVPVVINPGLRQFAPPNLNIGVALPGDFLARLDSQAIVVKNFNQIATDNLMKMKFMHPEEDTYTFSTADAYADFAKANHMLLHGHTLIWHSDYQVPDFMKNYPGGKAEFLAMLKSHVTTIVTHFSGKVTSWDVVNEAIDDSGIYRDSVFYRKSGTDFIDQAFINARAADRNADLYYNDYSIEQHGVKFAFLKKMLDGMLARHVPVSGIGFQMHVQLDFPEIAAIRSAFREIVARGLKVRISELDVTLNNPDTSGFVFASLTGQAAQLQKKRYCEIVKTYLETVPAALRGGITVWGIRDSESWILGLDKWQGHPDWPLLFDQNGREKAAFYGVRSALESKSCS